MKKTNWKGRFFSLLLAFVLLLPTILSTSVKAAPENDKNDGQIKHVTEISFTIYNYAIGNDANSIQVNCQTDGVRPTNYELLVYDKDKDEFVPVKGKLQADIQYRLKINFSPKDGYDFEGLTKEKIKLGAIGSAIRYRENKKEALFDMPTLTVTPEFKTLKFETNGGSTINSVTKTQDSTIELDQYKPTKDGFTFDGWYKDKELKEKITQVKLSEDMTVYAKWKATQLPPVKMFALNFITNGGSALDTIICPEGKVVDLEKYVPEKEGHIFDGWYLDEGLTNKAIQIKIEKDTSVYAKWTKKQQSPKPVNYFTLKFDTDKAEEIKPITKEENTIIDLNQYLPKKEGFIFDGWYKDKELKEKITQVKLTKDMTVYAKWIAKIPPVVTEEFTITIDPNGGNWNGDTKAKIMKIKKGDYITLPQAPSKKGYTFLYWKGSNYKPGDKYKVEKDHTFVAQWKKNEIKVSANNNSKTKAKNSPKTGVNSIAFVSLTLILISSLGLFVIGKKQKINK
ncbi:InlB B-repeat-containing protein [Anaerococcus vaginalis]|uniref:InlB B-repeat-containing protein n=1 Tax=Anaerococcus vaginalis TaxID=33037 RepID=UPI00290BA1DB|nr:InlB B-repeat-containing protein [Anaerococcus vaginalis]MDU5373084.1 InlB B-repeat-containing protein [Anaerococcus vaginalis]